MRTWRLEDRIPSIVDIRTREAAGLVTVRELDDLLICNYANKCTYSKAWDPVTKICRGLILRKDGAVVALPFSKFFNYTEVPLPSSPLVNVTEKLDGSLGVLYRHRGQHRIATRGSFESVQALWATERIQKYDLMDLPESYTLLFEIIYPENRVVVDYGSREDLVLIGCRNMSTSEDLDWPLVQDLAEKFGFSTPNVFATSLESLIAVAKTADANTEGWVLRFADGTRIKVKTNRYLEVSRLLSGLSKKHILESLIGGSLEHYLGCLPEFFRETAEIWRDEILGDIADLASRAEHMFMCAPKASRKEFALWVKATPEAPLLFALLDGKDILPMIYKKLLGDL